MTVAGGNVLTVGSLFAGIGGLELGLERAGMKTLWQVEIDEWCRAVLAKHWPDAERFVDVRDCGRANLRPVDLICGGFPCQDISQAGRGRGIRGDRSGLWSEFARIIGELRPRYVLVENVPLLRSRGLGVVLADLAALGYDAEWDCIPAIAVGAPHRRDRLFIVAYPNGVGHFHWKPKEFTAEARTEALREFVAGSPHLAYADREGQLQPPRAFGQERGRPTDSGWWEVEPDMGRVADGVPAWMDRIRGLGNAVVPQVAEFVGRRIIEAETREEVA